MRIPTVSALALFLFVPALEAQRGGGTRQAAPQRSLPSTPVMPMTNPVAPMTNPVGPIVPYGGAGVRGPGTSRIPPARPNNDLPIRIRDQRRQDVPVVIGAPYYGGPYYGSVWDYTYYDPYLRPATIPGQLPGVYAPPPDLAFSTYPAPDIAPVQQIAPAEPQPIFYPEPQMIITLPEPGREPPAIGTSRGDVLARYGEPWGSFTVRGKETLYLRGGLKVVLENGKVTQVQ